MPVSAEAALAQVETQHSFKGATGFAIKDEQPGRPYPLIPCALGPERPHFSS